MGVGSPSRADPSGTERCAEHQPGPLIRKRVLTVKDHNDFPAHRTLGHALPADAGHAGHAAAMPADRQADDATTAG